jgi:hypothetical protein
MFLLDAVVRSHIQTFEVLSDCMGLTRMCADALLLLLLHCQCGHRGDTKGAARSASATAAHKAQLKKYPINLRSEASCTFAWALSAVQFKRAYAVMLSTIC